MFEVLTGLLSGIISGTGMGGGTILILILSVFMGVNQHTAQATNLIFFIPTSITAILVATKEKLINWKLGITIALSGMVGAVIGAKICASINVTVLKKCFGIFLAIVAIYEIFSLIKLYRNDKNRNTNIKIGKE